MPTGYEKIYAALLPRLAECDLAQNGPRLGGALAGDAVRMPFLGRDYLITNGAVEPEDGKPADVNSLSVLIYYVTSNGAGDFLHDFALLHRLTGMIDGQNNLASGIMDSPLIREFADDYGRFERAMKSLGGVEILTPSTGKHVWQLLPLPKILSQIVFYEADEEFPADIQIMFDKSAPRFLDFECLAFMTGAMIRAVIKAGESVSDIKAPH
ncbi:MAG: DUF3786 domain-containing protein [Synergistaceae bacterium]|jgi:hypothetical protein|nr:DUF3786 domain-containing protein [Synergistaceae bacterium]